MDISRAQYEAADPEIENGFDVRDLNTASLGNNECIGSCSWTRRVENASDQTLTWTSSFEGPTGFSAFIDPPVFTLEPGDSQEIGIEINISAEAADGEWQFGSVNLADTSGTHPDAHWPLAVIPSSSNFPASLDIETQTTSGSVDIEDLVSRDISNFHAEVTGLKKADRHTFTLAQDNDTGADFPDIFFDDPATTHFIPINVPEGSFSVIADIVATPSTDLDMLLFLDADANGPDLADAGDPASNPNTCQSARGGSEEFCEILSPTAGTFYVAIINFSQVTEGGDPVDLATAVIPVSGADEGNMTISGPATVTDSSPYAVTVSYDEPAMTAIDKLYGYFTVGSAPDSPADVAKVRVGIEYLGIPDIDVNPAALAATVEQDATLTQALTMSTADGVLEWNVLTGGPGGEEAVEDGSFEAGYSLNPYWQAGASKFGSQLPICTASTCGPDIASDGDWYLWMGGAAELSAYAEQDITITSGDIANLRFKMSMGTASPQTVTATLTISLDGIPVAVFTEADLLDFVEYTLVDIDVSAFADGGSHELRFDFENPSAVNYNILIDEVSLIAGPAEAFCKDILEIRWLDVNPRSGILYSGETDLLVTFDAGGLEAGVYTDNLCVASNNPDEPLLAVPVSLTVVRPDRMFSNGFE
jgi:hypothetical protein